MLVEGLPHILQTGEGKKVSGGSLGSGIQICRLVKHLFAFKIN